MDVTKKKLLFHRTILAIAAHKNLKVSHIYIKNAFLHGNLGEEAYTAQTEAYINSGEENKV